MAVDGGQGEKAKLQHCALKQPFVYRAKIILCILLGREEVVTCALQNGKGGYGAPESGEGLGECGKEAGSRRQRDPGGRGEGGSAARREARGRQRGSEGGPGTAARLGGRPGYGSAARWEARSETAARLGGRHGGWAAARLGGRPGYGSAARWEARTETAARLGGPREARRLGGSAARREARRRQRGSVGGPETVRFGERESGEVEEAVQCSHSKNHSPFLLHKQLPV